MKYCGSSFDNKLHIYTLQTKPKERKKERKTKVWNKLQIMETFNHKSKIHQSIKHPLNDNKAITYKNFNVQGKRPPGRKSPTTQLIGLWFATADGDDEVYSNQQRWWFVTHDLIWPVCFYIYKLNPLVSYTFTILANQWLTRSWLTHIRLWYLLYVAVILFLFCYMCYDDGISVWCPHTTMVTLTLDACMMRHNAFVIALHTLNSWQ